MVHFLWCLSCGALIGAFLWWKSKIFTLISPRMLNFPLLWTTSDNSLCRDFIFEERVQEETDKSLVSFQFPNSVGSLKKKSFLSGKLSTSDVSLKGRGINTELQNVIIFWLQVHFKSVNHVVYTTPVREYFPAVWTARSNSCSRLSFDSVWFQCSKSPLRVCQLFETHCAGGFGIQKDSMDCPYS